MVKQHFEEILNIIIVVVGLIICELEMMITMPLSSHKHT